MLVGLISYILSIESTYSKLKNMENDKARKINVIYKELNKAFLLGNIDSEIKFDFLIGQKEKSMAKFILALGEGVKVEVRAYDEIADRIYRCSFLYNIKEILIEGTLRQNGTRIYVELKDFFMS